jgi:hypothetical protein
MGRLPSCGEDLAVTRICAARSPMKACVRRSLAGAKERQRDEARTGRSPATRSRTLAAYNDTFRHADAANQRSPKRSAAIKGFKSAAGHQSPRSPLRTAPLIWWLVEPPRSSSGFTVHNTGGHFDAESGRHAAPASAAPTGP